jgi:uncharacterized membrane protein
MTQVELRIIYVLIFVLVIMLAAFWILWLKKYISSSFVQGMLFCLFLLPATSAASRVVVWARRR